MGGKEGGREEGRKVRWKEGRKEAKKKGRGEGGKEASAPWWGIRRGSWEVSPARPRGLLRRTGWEALCGPGARQALRARPAERCERGREGVEGGERQTGSRGKWRGRGVLLSNHRRFREVTGPFLPVPQREDFFFFKSCLPPTLVDLLWRLRRLARTGGLPRSRGHRLCWGRLAGHPGSQGLQRDLSSGP